MSEFKVNAITNRDGNHGPQICGITTFGSSGMQLPSGPTEFRGGLSLYTHLTLPTILRV